MTMTATSSNGCARPFPRTRSPSSTGSRPIAPSRKVLGEDVEIDIVALDETNTRIRPERIAGELARNGGFGMVAFVGVQSNQFPHAHGHRAQIAGRRRAGRDRRLPCLGLPRHVAADAGRSEGGAGARHLALRRRGRGPARARASRRGDGRAAPALRFHEGSPLDRGGADALPADRSGRAHRRARHELRCRARLPVPMLVLHHHQRAGAQIPLPHARRRRGDRARQSRARRALLLHHRRQSRAQQELGADLRPAHRGARRHGREFLDRHPGRHALPPHPELHREGGEGRREARLPRAREHQSRQPDRRQEEAESHRRIPHHAARLEGGRLLHLCGLYPRLPQRHGRPRSSATSRSSSASCRSTFWNSSA